MKPATSLSLDVLAIALFALFARIAHQSETMPLNFSGWVSTFWPFLTGVVVAWVLVAVVRLRGSGFAAGTLVWIITVVIGLCIWWLRNDRVPHISFIIVASVSSAILLFGWRLLANRRGARPVK